MLPFYHSLTKYSGPALRQVLKKRLKRGKEDPVRISERMGQPGQPRPAGSLAWFHAASVGEAQSTLILIKALLDRFPDLNILVTTGTVTSANLMEQRLPARTLHQYYPLDHPQWVENFLNHWNPNLVFWMESELWPNMLRAIRMRNIHCILVNARMSKKSYRRWKHAGNTAATLLSAFDLCLAQTREDAESFTKLRALNVQVRDNLKYAADPLPFDTAELARLKEAIRDRPVWVYASTHDGEEQLACNLHKRLKPFIPGLLTIIVPRHPERRKDIIPLCINSGLKTLSRGKNLARPHADTEIYVADTLGELGLFYRLCPVTCIGRTFSRDGGGGHNPIEPAQLCCAVLHGPRVQNLQKIFNEMDAAGAAISVGNEDEFFQTLKKLLGDSPSLVGLQAAGKHFAGTKAATLKQVMKDIEPLLIDSGVMKEDKQCA
jgi:3-deoxy-D-manno-octulosonic-acid transferase